MPFGFGLMLVKKKSDNCVMAIGKNVGLDEHLLADHALRRIAAAVDLRADRLDDRAGRGRLAVRCRLMQA